jgi:hypothetical protein
MNPNTIGRKFLENSETIRHTTGAFSAIAQRDYVSHSQAANIAREDLAIKCGLP